jgi:carbamoyl-phosphate synthase small subunit
VLPSFSPALLALADGTVFRGYSIGAPGHTIGEVVFNTAITGYQEILTDPSYARQIVTLTYPHIGNVGVNAEDVEATKVHAAGLIIRDLPVLASNFRMERTLTQYLQDEGVVAIAGLDTRMLTRVLRDKGAQNGAILAGSDDEAKAIELARSFPGLAGMDLAKVVSTKETYEWTQTEWRLESGYGKQNSPKYRVVAFDYGVKYNILRMLAERGCHVTVLPAEASAADALALNPDGIFLSNGPGDPEPCDYAIAATKELIERGIPTFGICLGHQIMGLALGAQTTKLPFGHHGANHPVRHEATGRVEITSQNHNYVVQADTVPGGADVTHVNLNDGTVEGLRVRDVAAFSVQHHPEASPGPHEAAYLFADFTDLMAGLAPGPIVPRSA